MSTDIMKTKRMKKIGNTKSTAVWIGDSSDGEVAGETEREVKERERKEIFGRRDSISRTPPQGTVPGPPNLENSVNDDQEIFRPESSFKATENATMNSGRHMHRTLSFSRVEERIATGNGTKKRKAKESPELGSPRGPLTEGTLDRALAKLNALDELMRGSILVTREHWDLVKEVESFIKVHKAEDMVVKERLNRATAKKEKRDEEIRRKVGEVACFEDFTAISHMKWPEDAYFGVGFVPGNPFGGAP